MSNDGDKISLKEEEGEVSRTNVAVLPSFDSILTRLSHHADVTPDKTAISFLQTNGNSTPTISSSITYQTLNSAVEYLASRLLSLDDTKNNRLIPISLTRGDRVLLVYPPCSPYFLLTFLACIRAGLVAVPVYPPHPDRKDSVLAFVGIVRGCGAKVALTNGEYSHAKRLVGMKNVFITKSRKAKTTSWPEELVWVVTDSEPLHKPPSIDVGSLGVHPESHEIAFIQYTSGSTSAPKGVTLTHGNLAHNLHIITNELKADTDTIVVSWLPQYHDMGLIGSLLGVLYCGGSGYYMSPIAFLQRPMGWLEAVSEYRGTHLQAPNFAFGLTARKFDPDEYCSVLGGDAIVTQRKGKVVKTLDLSCTKHIVNGAEPVTEKSMEAFRNAFSPYGLPDGVIYPTYGLAEHTVFVCSGGKGVIAVKKKELEEENRVVVVDDTKSANNHGILHFAGCGFPSTQSVDVRIVDPPRSLSLPEGHVGEIWINSPSKALGYYGKSELETRFDFHSFLADEMGNTDEMSRSSGGYLKSGDLGFLYQKQLYICGRIKDLIIVGGRNHYPQDIESTAEDLVAEHVRPGCSAAFSLDVKPGKMGDDATIVLAMELREPLPKKDAYEEIVDAIQTEIIREHSLSLSCIIFVKQKTLPKTTSGKIMRSKTQQAFVGKALQEVYRKDFSTRSDNSENGSGTCHTENGTIEMTQKKQPEPKQGTDLTPAQIRDLSKPEIRNMILIAISQLTNADKATIKDTAPLISLMDSVTLAQLKGLLEGRFAVKPMSDAYLFQDSTTVKKLVEIVKVGAVNDDSGEGQAGGAYNAVGSSGGPGCCGCIIM
jgi:acyl-CoA synthetase (AMP-forming)/AMP-acid ligase II